MSEEATCKLGLKIDNEVGRIKTVNSECVPIKGVAKGVDLQLRECSEKVSIKLLIRIWRVFTQTFLSSVLAFLWLLFIFQRSFLLRSFAILRGCLKGILLNPLSLRVRLT
ncbi:hypothetical protein Gotur_003067 [Gossypium turneri]